jgi:protoheme IX farnesyltransferase
MKKLLSAYLELTKPRILSLVLITTTLGFFLGGKGTVNPILLIKLLFGVAMVCGGSATLNHYLERDADSRMERTCRRPIPQGTISPSNALIFGVLLILGGVFLLCWEVNLLTSFLSLLTAFLYVLVYTPMKKVSWLNTTIGAIPGALPPMGGWAAATGDLSLGAWVLFFILFVWQHPHFYSIAWMYKDDYRRGGFKMLPVVYPNGRFMFTQITFFALALIPISLLPTFLGMSGRLYFYGALIAGIFFLTQGIKLAATHSISDAHKLLRVSVIYLPIILFLIVVDASF